jgi:bidirectional [NiFe] hydrogenase diaphorase subunit
LRDHTQSVERRFGTVARKTTADGQVSLMTARCLGSCGPAPVAVYDGQVAGNQGPELALEHTKRWLDDGPR